MRLRSLLIVICLGLSTRLLISPCSAKSVWNGDKDRYVVALTFDDGPKPEYCTPILDDLDKYGAKATFFVVGSEAEKNPDLVKRMHDEGNIVGNHSYSHIPAKDMTNNEFIADVKKCSLVIFNIIGKPPRYFRPPGGEINPQIAKGLKRMGLKTVFWTFNSEDYTELSNNFELPDDYQKMADVLAKKVLDGVTPGAIILLHSSSEQTVLALPAILEGINAKGYGMVTVDELIKENI
jgi:peptidoglycan-N-acetylglucosamine deacetylase